MRRPPNAQGGVHGGGECCAGMQKVAQEHELLRAVPLDRFRRDVLKIASTSTGWLTSSNGTVTVAPPERKSAPAEPDRLRLSTTNSKTYDKNAPADGIGTGDPRA